MLEFDRNAAGAAVRRIRVERGLSQEVLSGLAGMARSHLAMVEAGRKQPNFESIWRLANALGMEPSQLVKRIEEETECRAKEK